MALQYQISNLQGTDPFDISVCDKCSQNSFCIYIDTITTADLPYIFTLPATFENSSEYCIKAVDRRGCEECECINTTQSPTPSVTPSITPSISVTPTISVTPSITPSITPTISITPSITPTISITPSITPTISVTPSITPTISVTPSVTPEGVTPTPTRTPIPSGSLVLFIQANYSPIVTRPNETSVEYIATISQAWPVPIEVNFQDVIYKNDNTSFTGQNPITIQSGNLTSTVTKTLTIPYEILTQVTEFQNISWSVNSSPVPEFEYVITGYTYVGGRYTTPTPTISLTPSVTPTISITPSITPTISLTPSITPSTSSITYTYDVITGNTIENTCLNEDIVQVYSTSSGFTNGMDLYLNESLSEEIDEFVYIQYTGETVYVSVTGGTINLFGGACPTPTPTTTVTSSVTPTITPTISITPSTTPTISITPSITPTITPTISPTQSLTPSITPTPSLVNTGLTINFDTTIESGSTIINYNIISSEEVTQDTDINFTNILQKTDNSRVIFNTGVTISSGSTSATTTVNITTTDYSDLVPWYISFSAVTTTGDEIGNLKTYNSVNFINDDSPIYQPYIFRGCCQEDGIKNLFVTSDAVSPGGWVTIGQGVIINNRCYTPYQPGGDGSDGYVYGPQIKNCQDGQCPPCVSVTPSVTPTTSITPTPTQPQSYNVKLISCCDYSLTYANLLFNTNIGIGDYISYSGQCWAVGNIESTDTYDVSISGSFETCDECQLVQSCPSPTPTMTVSPSITPTTPITPTPSVTHCINGLDCSTTGLTDCILDCSTEISEFYAHRAERCCPGPEGQTIFTEIMIPTGITTTDIIFFSGYCWLVGGTTNENNNIVTDNTVYDNCIECHSCNSIDCNPQSYVCKLNTCCPENEVLISEINISNGEPCVGQGFVSGGTCYEIINVSIGSVGINFDYNNLVDDICQQPECQCQTPTPTPTVSITPTPSVLTNTYSNFILADCETGLLPFVVEINDNLLPVTTDQGIQLEPGKCYNIVSPGGDNPQQTLDSLIDNVCENCT